MHHEEGLSGRSHWDELAEQLGLPPENGPASAKMKEPQPSVHRPQSDLNEPQRAEEEIAETLHTPESPPDADAGSEDDRPARRRRGRRGGRRHRETREEAGSERPRRSRNSGRGEKRPRKTRPSRSAEEPPSENLPDLEADLPEARDDYEIEPQPPLVDSAEPDDEEIEKISDWNVPSWAEIVSGLYRP